MQLSTKLYYFTEDSHSSRQSRSKSAYSQATSTLRAELGDVDALVAKSPLGKPYFIKPSNMSTIEMLPYYLSMSHCLDFSVLAYSTMPIGIDCETMKTRPYQERLLRRILRNMTHLPADIPTLLRVYKTLPLESQNLVFFKLWTYLEATSKLNGWPLWQALGKKIRFFTQNFLELLSTSCFLDQNNRIDFHQPTPKRLVCTVTVSPPSPLSLVSE